MGNLFEPESEPEIGWKPFLKRAVAVVAVWALMAFVFWLLRYAD